VIIPCEQFVYSKFIGAARSAPYSIIARSPNLTDDLAKDIREVFNGCRPNSVNLSSYNTTRVITPFKDKIIFLRLDAVQDSTSGNKYILHEQYLIVKKNEVNHIAIWEILRKVPAPGLFSTIKVLDNFVEINKSEISLGSVLKDFPFPQAGGIKEVLPVIYYLLNSRKVVLVVQQENFKLKWFCLLSAMLPSIIQMGLRVFWGDLRNVSFAFDFALASSATHIEQHQLGDTLVFEPNRNKEELNLDSGYTDFLLRCTLSNNQYLLEQVISWTQNLNINIPDEKEINLDVVLKKEIPHKIRLELSLDEHKRGIFSKDIYTLWQEHTLSVQDFQIFLPSLILNTLGQWSDKDFLNFTYYTNKLSSNQVKDILLQGGVSSNIQISMLFKWGEKFKTLSSSDIDLWVTLLLHLASQDPTKSFDLLGSFLKFIDLRRSSNLIKILGSFPSNVTFQDLSFWKIVFWVFHFSNNVNDLRVSMDILTSITFFNEVRPILSLLKYLLAREYAENYDCSIFHNVFLVANKSRVIYAFFPHLVNIVLLSNYPEALVTFILALSNFSIPKILNHGVRGDFTANKDIIYFYKSPVLESKNEKYIAAYIFLLSKLSHNEKAREILTSVLISDLDLFNNVVTFSRLTLKENFDDFWPSIPMLQNIKAEEQLKLLIIYIIQTKAANLSGRLVPINKLLGNIKTLKYLEPELVEEFLSYLIEYREWMTARMILEHQTRNAILSGSSDVDTKLEKLHSVICYERKETFSDKTKKTVIFSYFNNLSSADKNEFSAWLLLDPLSSSPILRRAKYQPFTSKVIFDNLNDPLFRCYLFQELSMWKGLI